MQKNTENTKTQKTRGFLCFCVFVFSVSLLPAAAWTAGDKRIGDRCESNSDCISGDCERSQHTDPSGDRQWYCDCSEWDIRPWRQSNSPQCARAYGGGSNDWKCIDGGDGISYDLDYCQSTKDNTDIRFPAGSRTPTVLDTVLDPEAALRATGNEFDKILKTPQPRIRIPGLTFTDATKLPVVQDDRGQVYLYVPFIGEYIAAVYRYGIIVIAFVAIVYIIQAGFAWATSGGNSEEIENQKKKIMNAVIGVIIAVTSYSILYFINPSLVKFQSLRVAYIPPEPLDVEGIPEFGVPASASITVLSTEGKPAGCTPQNLAKFSEFEKNNNKFGRENGYCLGWVKEAINASCGGIPQSLSVNGAWDVAAAFFIKEPNKFHPCTLDGAADGDLVFMTSMESNYIGLWGNFRLGADGCTIADALPAGQAKRREGGGSIANFTPVAGQPQGMPPVTHIGVYVGGKVYHLLNKVAFDAASDAKQIENNPRGQKSGRPNWKDITLTGKFIHNKGEFIAGYASW